jgi:hypoxanthine phosphoribosyltransferase
MDFLSVSSYGDSTTSSGNIKVNLDISNDIDGKDVLIVEDIVDTGLTMSKLLDTIKAKSPRSTKLATLLYKPSRTEHQVHIDYLAFTIEDEFVIGYGLDYAGKYRQLPHVAIYSEE